METKMAFTVNSLVDLNTISLANVSLFFILNFESWNKTIDVEKVLSLKDFMN